MKRLRCIAVVLLFSSAFAADTSPKLTAPAPAPDVFSKAQWCWASTCAPGAWYTDRQVQVLAAKLDYLEGAAAKECVDKQVSAAKLGLPNWAWFVGGVVAGGVVGIIVGKNL